MGMLPENAAEFESKRVAAGMSSRALRFDPHTIDEHRATTELRYVSVSKLFLPAIASRSAGDNRRALRHDARAYRAESCARARMRVGRQPDPDRRHPPRRAVRGHRSIAGSGSTRPGRYRGVGLVERPDTRDEHHGLR